MATLSRERREALVAYLSSCSGRDVLECADAAQARELAQDLRAQLAGSGEAGIGVEQRQHRVILSLAVVAATHA